MKRPGSQDASFEVMRKERNELQEENRRLVSMVNLLKGNFLVERHEKMGLIFAAKRKRKINKNSKNYFLNLR